MKTKKVIRYECPSCGEYCETEDEAIECCGNIIRRLTMYECSECNEVYEDIAECEECCE